MSVHKRLKRKKRVVIKSKFSAPNRKVACCGGGCCNGSGGTCS